MANKKTVVVIAGPTAVGKTSVAIEVAKHFDTEIISADSRQCYQEMNIGVARPSDEELAAVNHYFIASHSVHANINAAFFEQYALEKAAAIFQHNKVAVMVGGTGLYIKAFCDGLDEIPNVPKEIREEVNHQYEEKGISWLQEEIEKLDPKFYRTGEMKNPHRMLRALEVYKATGKSIIDFRSGQKQSRDFDVIKIALDLPKEQLHYNINTRADKMMEAGLIEEVKALMPLQHLKALQTVGYQELFAYFNNEIGLNVAIEEIKKHTRQYAKRQLTWFRKDKQYKWYETNAAAQIIQEVEQLV